jgi:hypothetical protein
LQGAGGAGGGGTGANNAVVATAGTANLGGGGGAPSGTTGFTAGATGGSGVVVLRFSSLLQIKVGSGLTYTVASSGGDQIVTITAGTDVVSWS